MIYCQREWKSISLYSGANGPKLVEELTYYQKAIQNTGLNETVHLVDDPLSMLLSNRYR